MNVPLMKKICIGLCLAARFALGGGPALAAQAPAAFEPATAICYMGTEGFVVSTPDGWVNDARTAQRLGLCALFLPEGTDFDSAPGVIYPRTLHTEHTGAAAADAQAEHARASLAELHPQQAPHVVQGDNIVTHEGGEHFFVRHLRQGPAPNAWETLACLVKNNVVFMLVLSCQEEAQLTALQPALRQTAQDVLHMRVVQQK